jgi:hypothetical protein
VSDTYAIASTIAFRFYGATKPSGQPNLVLGTHVLPVGLPGLPALLVFPPDEPDIGESLAASHRSPVQSYPVRFYLVQEPSDGPDITALHGWRYAFQDRILGNQRLGRAGVDVAWAWIDRISPATLSYAGQNYLGLDMVVQVKIDEPITAVD